MKKKSFKREISCKKAEILHRRPSREYSHSLEFYRDLHLRETRLFRSVFHKPSTAVQCEKLTTSESNEVETHCKKFM